MKRTFVMSIVLTVAVALGDSILSRGVHDCTHLSSNERHSRRVFN